MLIATDNNQALINQMLNYLELKQIVQRGNQFEFKDGGDIRSRDMIEGLIEVKVGTNSELDLKSLENALTYVTEVGANAAEVSLDRNNYILQLYNAYPI